MVWKKWKFKRRGQEKGYDFEDEIAKSLGWYHIYQERIFFYKMADTHAVRGAINQIRRMFYDLPQQMQDQFSWILNSFRRITFPKQPGDFLLIYLGLGGVLELKSLSTENRFRLRDVLKEHQMSYANKIELYGAGFYYLLFNNRNDRGEHTVDIFNRKEVQQILIDESINNRTWSFDEIRCYSHIERIYAVRNCKELDVYSKWELTPLFQDIIRERHLEDS